VRIPFAVGGGLASLDDMARVLLAGAEKVSVNSLAVRNPQIIADGARSTPNIRPGRSALSPGASSSRDRVRR
jgi:cyclase